MRPLLRASTMLLFFVTAMSASAQPGGPGGGGRGGPGPMTAGAGRSGGANPVGATAEFLLAHTGDLALTDVREAIAVLTPDQHATAWMMIAGGGPLGGGPGMGFGTGPGQLDAGAPRDRGPISRPPAARDVPRRPDGASSTTP